MPFYTNFPVQAEGTNISSLVAGANVEFAISNAALTISDTGGSGPGSGFKGGSVLQKMSVQSLGGGDQIVLWTGTDYDTLSFWNSSDPSKLTVPASGVNYVRLTCNLYIDSGSSNPGGIYFKKNAGTFNGSGYNIIEYTAPVYLGCVSQVVSVAPGDYFQVICGATSGQIGGDFHNNFGIEVLG